MFTASRPAKSSNIVVQSVSSTRWAISRGEIPAAYAPPTSAPMLVPAMQATGMRSSSSTSSTPRWAPPRAPPPPSTRPTRGGAAAGCWAHRGIAATARRTVARKRLDMGNALLDSQGEGGEPGVAVVVVDAFVALQPTDDRVGHGREQHLDRDLGQELREHHLRQRLVRDDSRAPERERIEEERVDSLAED